VIHVKKSAVMLTSDRQIDRRILLSAESLKAAGWHVTIIAMPLDSETSDEGKAVRIGSNLHKATRENKILAAYRWIRRHIPMNGRLMRWMKQLAWRYLVDQEYFYLKLFHSTASRYSPQVFVANDLPMLPVAKVVAEKCGALLVYDSHELYSEQEFSKREQRRWAQIEAKYIRECSAVITVNQSIANELKKRYSLNHVHVIYNAERVKSIPQSSRRLHELLKIKADKKIVLLQGGVSAGRNLEILVSAMRYVTNEHIVLVILGDGLLVRKLKKIAALQGLNARVYFHDAVPQNELLTLTASADAGVIPYQANCLNNLYCTPNKLFEFIAAGIPIIATDLPEIRNLVEGNSVGLVGDTSSPRAMAGLIDDFFSNERRFVYWKSQLALTRERVCWEQEEKKLVAIYEGLL
jgi:glycosyltransferase involved in cell wall biosynthesis